MATGAASLWGELLPADLARLDALLDDRALLEPIVGRFADEATQIGSSPIALGRPTIAIETDVRLMVLKHRYRWGYRTLMAEVSDSIHLRRFCRIGLSERVPDESTVRKLTRRLGPAVVDQITRAVIAKATRERRFRARAVRIDSTVIEADIRYPTDAGLAGPGVRALAGAGRALTQALGQGTARVRDRSRAMGRRLRAVSRTIRRRSGQARAEVLALTAQTGALLERSVAEARALVAPARRTASGDGAQATLRAATALEELAERCARVTRQIRQRVGGEKITDRLVSLADPDARPILQGQAR